MTLSLFPMSSAIKAWKRQETRNCARPAECSTRMPQRRHAGSRGSLILNPRRYDCSRQSGMGVFLFSRAGNAGCPRIAVVFKGLSRCRADVSSADRRRNDLFRRRSWLGMPGECPDNSCAIPKQRTGFPVVRGLTTASVCVIIAHSPAMMRFGKNSWR
jgi:hypothetical protein